MTQPPATLENSLRSIRIFYSVVLFATILQVQVAEMLSHPAPREIHAMWLGFLVIGLMEVGVAFFFRIKMVQPAVETLQERSDDRIALGRWRAGNILCFVLANSIALFELALRFIGGTTTQAPPFYIGGISLFLL